MAHPNPAHTAPRPPRRSARGSRRGRVLLGTVAVLVLLRAGFTATGHLPTANGGVPRARLPVHGTEVLWPPRGQAAFVLGDGRLQASPHQQPAPIASLAKVMTAYLTLGRYPLSGEQEGFTVTVTEAQAQAAADDAARGQSVVAVRAGEQLTERQLLEALLVPSGNNIAQLLSEAVAGGVTGFVEAMNAEARSLAMGHTVYTDPSGFDAGTVSTAADQLRLLRRAMRSGAFRAIVSMPAVTLPVAGTLHNFNPLVADGYAGKTGSDSAAGGCLAFFTHVTARGHRLTAAGVVMGQGEGSNTAAILAAAAEAAEQLVESGSRAAAR